MGFLKPVLLEFGMGIQMTEEFYNLLITYQMPKLCMCQAYLFEKTLYQANISRVYNYNNLHRVDPISICVKFDIIVPTVSDIDHILIQRNKIISLVTFVVVIRTTEIH